MSVASLAGLAVAASVIAICQAWTSARRESTLLPVRTAAEAPRRPATRRARRTRKRAAHDDVPQLLDLLAAGSTAGLSAEASFRQAAACLHGPLGDDLGGGMRAGDPRGPLRRGPPAPFQGNRAPGLPPAGAPPAPTPAPRVPP